MTNRKCSLHPGTQKFNAESGHLNDSMLFCIYVFHIVFLWNSLPTDIKSSSSVALIKSKLYLFYTNKVEHFLRCRSSYIELGKLCVAMSFFAK